MAFLFSSILLNFVLINGDQNFPNIILIIADDLGFNDVSYHGSTQIPTPNIDALAYSGIILNNYYVSPICTPSRSALFSGMHPIHTGMQHDVIYGATPYGLPLEYKLLPQVLKERYNYATHLIGKWHLGHYRRSFTPNCRGFDTFYGHLTGHKDYYENTAQEQNPQAWGYDNRRNFEVSHEYFGLYATDIYTTEAQKVIERHNVSSNPLFLTVSHTAVHSANPYQLLQAPQDVINKFSYIKDTSRRIFAAMVTKLDESVGHIVKALADKKMLENSIVIFTTDNGGPAAGFNGNAASNWPLRGVKNTLWEGGVKGAALIWSPLLNSLSRVSNQLIHIQDWLPTLIGAIEDQNNYGNTLANLSTLDGIDLWNSLSNNEESPRTQLLHNIDDIYGNEGVRVGNWKLLHGTTYGGKWDYWYGPSGLEEFSSDYTKSSTSFSLAKMSMTGQSISKITSFPNNSKASLMQNEAKVQCNKGQNITACNLSQGDYCLFNINEDHCEYNNLAEEEPEMLQKLKEALQLYRDSAVNPINQPKDPRGEPKNWDYTWTNWMDNVDDKYSSSCQ